MRPIVFETHGMAKEYPKFAAHTTINENNRFHTIQTKGEERERERTRGMGGIKALLSPLSLSLEMNNS